jgi:hypothetical protein
VNQAFDVERKWNRAFGETEEISQGVIVFVPLRRREADELLYGVFAEELY